MRLARIFHRCLATRLAIIPRPDEISGLAVLCLALLLAGCVSESPRTAQQLPKAQQATADAINRARVHTELGAGYYARGQYAVALEELGEALSAYPGYAPALNVRGLVYMDLKEDARAEESFQQALRSDPNEPDVNNNYGWYLCQRGDPKRALGHFQVALRNPLYATPERAYVNSGLCARKAGDDATAEEHFRQALAVAPSNSQALYQMADLSFARGRFRDARSFLARYQGGARMSAEGYWLAIRTENRLGDRSAEASFASQLCRQYPDSRECQNVRSGVER